MTKALVLLAAGFEEMEAVIIIDVLRRAEVSVRTASLAGLAVPGAHGLTLQADVALDAELERSASSQAYDAVVLPGGQPGSRHLRDDLRVRKLLLEQHARGKFVAAICAAPIALEAAGILAGRQATSFPGTDLPSANYQTDRVVVDGNIVTSRGPGTAFEFALTLAQLLVGADVASRLRESMLVA